MARPNPEAPKARPHNSLGHRPRTSAPHNSLGHRPRTKGAPHPVAPKARPHGVLLELARDGFREAARGGIATKVIRFDALPKGRLKRALNVLSSIMLA